MASQTKISVLKPVGAAEERHVSESLYQKALRRLLRDRLTMLALGFIVVLTIVSMLAPFLNTSVFRIDPDEPYPSERFQPLGTPGHILGTDDIGRDQLARLLVAGGISLRIGFLGAGLTLVIGMFFGIVTGFYGGVVDDVINWIITTLDSIPRLYLLILIAAVFRPTAETFIIFIALVGWTGTTRLIRGQTIQIRGLDYVTSARALGASSWRIMFTHILPNLISVTAVNLASSIGTLILAESALSFLGLGIQPPTATWGNMLTKAQEYFIANPHLVIPPGTLITLTVLCFYIIGDGVRDAFDPQTAD
jgi:ABC-type dipeptide/oligopeptide/nickel transport system permease subunit